MKFVSTRGQSDPVAVDVAIQAGLAPDGGLYVPAAMPMLPAAVLESGSSIAQLGAKVLQPFFADSCLEGELSEICRRAFDFPIPLERLRSKAGDVEARILELFHGPSSAFKDVGARFLAECMASLAPSGLTRVMVATSGDTGGAVAAAFYRRPGFEVVILFPEEGVSEEQAQQLTCWGENVRSFAVSGTFDDCQRMLKETLEAGSVHGDVRLTTANSINIARLLAQLVYYAFIAVELRGGQLPSLLVPSGNLGNATAAIWARRMGLPLGKIFMVTNANRCVPEYMEKGVWQPRPSLRTLANAMDVGAPSNMERIRHLFPEIDDLREGVAALSIDDAAIAACIQSGLARWGRVFDPHTATAVQAMEELGEACGPLPVVIATAHPAKFRSIVEALVGVPVEAPAALAELQQRPSAYESIPASTEALRASLSTEA